MVRPAKNRSSTRPALSRVERRQLVERHIEGQDVEVVWALPRQILAPRHSRTRLALDRPAGAGVIHEDSPHGLPGDPEKVRPVLPSHAPLIDQLEIRLVDQRRGRQRVIGALPPQAAAGPPAQLLIHDFHQEVAGLLVTVVPADEKRRHVQGLGHLSSGGFFISHRPRS